LAQELRWNKDANPPQPNEEEGKMGMSGRRKMEMEFNEKL